VTKPRKMKKMSNYAEKENSNDHLPSEHVQALYQLNIEAKRYRKKADRAYEHGSGRYAKVCSLRKQALYNLKDEILHRWAEQTPDSIDSIEKHTIDDREYLCFYVDEFSFHSPLDHWEEQSLPVDKDSESTKLDDFNSDPQEREDLMSEREALETLTAYESANYRLEQVFVDDSFAGWEYLPGVAENGERVDEKHLTSELMVEDFQFDVGDTFIHYRYSDSPITVTAKYYTWWRPFQMATYDARCEETGEVITEIEAELPRDVTESDRVEVIDSN